MQIWSANTVKRGSSFGSAIQSRSYASGAYRYGFNGKEEEDENFEGAYAFEARIYDSRLGRFLSVDPRSHEYRWQSSYVFAKNSPLKYVDLLGEGPGDAVKNGEGPAAYAKRNGTTMHQLAKANPTKFKNYPSDGTLAQQNAYWADNSGKNWQIHPGQSLEVGNTKQSIEPLNRTAQQTKPQTESPANLKKPIDYGAKVADVIRNSPFLPTGTVNPFFGASAIVGDIGLILVGAESDIGGVFMLVGPDKGKFYGFYEIAGGIAPEGGVGVELGRIDYWGNNSQFDHKDIYGSREKYFASVSPFGEFLSIGVGCATSRDQQTGALITTTALQVGLGLSTPFVSGGYNTGNVIPLDQSPPRTD